MFAYARLTRPAVVAAAVASLLAACDGGTAHQSAAAGAVLRSIQVTPSTADALVVPVGQSVQLTATGTFSDGSTSDVTALVNWGSSDDLVATVSSIGVASAAGVGTASITATDAHSSISGSVSLSAIGADLSLLSIAPIDPTILVATSLQLSASGLLTDDSIVDYTGAVSWSSSDPSIATVSQMGLLNAVALGSATISATDPVSGASDSILVTVTDVPLALAYVTLSRGSVLGGSSTVITGTVFLTSFIPDTGDPIEIALTSSDDTVLTVPLSVVIAPGSNSASFPVTTFPVAHRTRAYVFATDGTITKRARLNVRAAH